MLGGIFGHGVVEERLRLLVDFLGGSGPVFAFQQFLGTIASAVGTAFVGAALVILYLDLGGSVTDSSIEETQ